MQFSHNLLCTISAIINLSVALRIYTILPLCLALTFSPPFCWWHLLICISYWCTCHKFSVSFNLISVDTDAYVMGQSGANKQQRQQQQHEYKSSPLIDGEWVVGISIVSRIIYYKYGHGADGLLIPFNYCH